MGITTSGASVTSWVIRAPDDLSNKFAVMPDGGNHKLVLASGQSLDFEAIPGGEFDVDVWGETTDGVRSNTLTFTITVTEANDAPVFIPGTEDNGLTDGTETLLETATQGTEVARVGAHDADGDSVTYSIESGDPDNAFSIDGNGVIRVADASALDFETTETYTLTVTATDSNGATAPQDVTITIDITDTNDEMPDVDAPAGTIRTTTGNADNTETGYSITVTDADATAASMAPLTVTTPDPRFEFERAGANSDTWNLVLLANRALSAGTITLRYTATDGDNPTSGTITLMAVDTPVEFTAPATVADRTIDLNEDTATSTTTVHFTVQATSSNDAGPVGIASYMFLDDSDTATTTYRGFTIDSSSGEITLTSSLDHEDTHEDGSTINLRVEATDMNTPAETNILRLTVNVGDVNDNAPIFTVGQDVAATIPESQTAADGTILSITADDADGTAANRNVIYSIESGDPDGLFFIDPSSGDLRVADGATLNYDTDPATTSYTLMIGASDGRDASGTADTVIDAMLEVTITLTDVNDITPMVTPPTGGVFRVRTTDGLPADEIAQNSAAGTGYRITIDDADTNNVFTFNVSDPRFDFQAQGSADVTWELMLLAGQAVTEEEGDTITLTYHVNDGVANSVNVGQTTVTINVVDTPVEFATPDAADLMADENDADWTLTVMATSEDSNSDGTDSVIVSYEIIEVLDENDVVVASDGVFTIADRTIGKISISAGLDYETSASYTLVIQATDMAESAVPGDTADTNTARFTINVQDLNEHDPVIGPLQLAQA